MSAAPVARKQIRGSTLLMAGRGLSLALNFGVQIVIVRYLAKQEYGALAYALAMVTMLGRVSRFGMDKAAARFVTIHHERGEHSKLLGSLISMIATIVTLGGAIVLLVFGLRGTLGDSIVSNPLSMTLLLTVIAIAPLDALDTLLQSVFAVFARPRLIFLRKHVAGPLLKLLAVLGVVLAGGDVETLAVAYLAAGIVGLAIGASLTVRVFREARLPLWPRRMHWPLRKLVAFGLPMMSSDVVFVLRGTLVVMLLEFYHASAGVADYRAVLPVARLNRVALDSFALLFMPAVARLLERGERRSLGDLHWRSTLWVIVLSAPVFWCTFVLARPLTLLLFGDRYAGSAVVLAILSLGIFLQSGLALNSLALKAAGKVKQVMLIDALALVAAGLLSFSLIPRFGAVGGAVSLAATLVLHATIYQIGLARSTGLGRPPLRCVGVFAAVLLLTGLLWLAVELWQPPLIASLGLVGVAWLLLLRTSRRALDLERTFPEITRLPGIGALLGGKARRSPVGGPAVEEFLGRLPELFPDRDPSRLRFELAAARHGEGARLYELRPADGGCTLFVKEPVDAPAPVAAVPRIGIWADPRQIVRQEYETLRAIEERFKGADRRRFKPVRAFGLLPESGALVMERVRGRTLRALLSQEVWGAREIAPELSVALANAGAWLRAFHAMEPLPHSVRRRTTRSEFVDSLQEFAGYLERSGEERSFLQEIASRTGRAAERLLPESMPVGLGHGDFAPRNVLVGEAGEVAVIDTPGRWIFPVYQDLGYFFTALNTLALRVATQGVALGDAKLRSIEQAFLAGYYADEPIPRETIRLFEIQTLLSRWVSAVHDHRAASRRRWSKQLALTLKRRWCRRGLSRATAALLECRV